MGSGASKDSKKRISTTFSVANASPYTIYAALIREEVFVELRKKLKMALKVCSNGGGVTIDESKSFDQALLQEYRMSLMLISPMHSQTFARSNSNYLSVSASKGNGKSGTICYFHNLQGYITGVVFSAIPEIHIHNCESGDVWIDAKKRDHREDFVRIEEYMDAQRKVEELKFRNRISDITYTSRDLASKPNSGQLQQEIQSKFKS